LGSVSPGPIAGGSAQEDARRRAAEAAEVRSQMVPKGRG
jgi:hypothetical protein